MNNNGNYNNENTIIHTINNLLNSSLIKERIEFVEDRYFNDMRYHINSDKIRQLGWKEEMTWEEGIRRTFEWYLRNQHRYVNINDVLQAHPKLKL